LRISKSINNISAAGVTAMKSGHVKEKKYVAENKIGENK